MQGPPGRSHRRSSTRALASADGIARTLAARYQLPLIDLGMITVDPEASKIVPLHVLERSAAIPYQIDGDVLRVAVSDPATSTRSTSSGSRRG